MKEGEKARMADERRKAANRIREGRRLERLDKDLVSYENDRGSREYLYRLGGLEQYFNYIRSLSDAPRVLDVGTGKGRAIRQIQNEPFARGINFETTTLQDSQELQENLQKEQIHLTSAEVLRGVDRDSFAGVIGVHSIAYAHPALSLKAIDSVLVAGGALKATFRSFGEDRPEHPEFRAALPFLAELAGHGYDVAFRDVRFCDLRAHGIYRGQIYENALVLAIKPGNADALPAQQLLDRDLEVFSNLESMGGMPIVTLD